MVALLEDEPSEVDGGRVHRLVQAVDEDEGFRLGSGQFGRLPVPKVFGPEVAEAGGRLRLRVELGDGPCRDLGRHGVAAGEDEEPAFGVGAQPVEAGACGGAAGLVHWSSPGTWSARRSFPLQTTYIEDALFDRRDMMGSP